MRTYIIFKMPDCWALQEEGSLIIIIRKTDKTHLIDFWMNYLRKSTLKVYIPQSKKYEIFKYSNYEKI